MKLASYRAEQLPEQLCVGVGRADLGWGAVGGTQSRVYEWPQVTFRCRGEDRNSQ